MNKNYCNELEIYQLSTIAATFYGMLSKSKWKTNECRLQSATQRKLVGSELMRTQCTAASNRQTQHGMSVCAIFIDIDVDMDSDSDSGSGKDKFTKHSHRCAYGGSLCDKKNSLEEHVFYFGLNTILFKPFFSRIPKF